MGLVFRSKNIYLLIRFRSKSVWLSCSCWLRCLSDGSIITHTSIAFSWWSYMLLTFDKVKEPYHSVGFGGKLKSQKLHLHYPYLLFFQHLVFSSLGIATSITTAFFCCLSFNMMSTWLTISRLPVWISKSRRKLAQSTTWLWHPGWNVACVLHLAIMC